MKFSIYSLKENMEKINEVLLLHKVNAKTLGFLPKKAFQEAAWDDKILIAVNEENQLLGYLLYNVNKRGNFVYITHLCVEEAFRKQHIAKDLVDKLVDLTNYRFRGIRVTCRSDYEATKVWESFHFVFVHQKQGRSKKGSTLFIYWRDFNHPDLFSSADLNLKLKVCLDSNIFFDLMDKENSKNRNSHALLSDWLIEDVEYCITEQLNNDIAHNKDIETRNQALIFLREFNKLKSDSKLFNNVYETICSIYNKNLNYREESDIRHLTYTINSDANYFLTKDEGIIRFRETLEEKFGLLVFRPEEFLIHFSSLLNNLDYQPERFSGTLIQKKRVKSDEFSKVSEIFFIPEKEKKRKFHNQITSFISSSKADAYTLSNLSEDIIFFSIREDQDYIQIDFLRHIARLKNKTIINQLVYSFILRGRENNKKILSIHENFLDDDVKAILLNYNFVEYQGNYYKIILNRQVKFSDIKTVFEEEIISPALRKIFLNKIEPFLDNKKNAFIIERILFPLKIIDSGIPCFIIPIQPKWAMNMFHVELSDQDLFGGESELLFNKENAYYRAAKPKVLIENSRILWYVSRGDSKRYNTMNISTYSYLKEIKVSKPKPLYTRYKHYGIYKWDDIKKTAHNDLGNNIMAFSFDYTENFVEPIRLSKIKEIFQVYLNKSFMSITPLKIDEEIFFRIYNLGMKNG